MKKWFVVLISIVFVFTGFGSASAAPLFTDVKDNYWVKAEMDFLAEKGIITPNPNERFGVNDEITRLEASTMIVKALGLETENRPAPNFIDVLPEDESYDIIAAIVDEGIMVGNNNGQFMPQKSLTRAEMAKILVIAFDLKGTSDYNFRDIPTTYWGSPFIKTLFANEVTTGYENNTYKPGAFLTKSHFAIFLARILNPEFKQPFACYQPDNAKTYVVDVQVTSLWKEPNKARKVDQPSLSKPVDMAKWTKSMTTAQKQWLVGKVDTQALYGQEVSILKTSGNWVQIAVKDQYVPHQKAGYPGWVPKSHITEQYPNYKNCPIAVVDVPIASLYHDANTSRKFMDISYTTILPIIKEEGNWLHVQTPANGVKYLRKQDVKTFQNYASIPKPTQKDIVNDAKMFMGLPYLWAGTSGFGFDCSGIIHSVYKNHGILIPRDSFVQAVNGKPVAKNQLQAGDLVFFAYSGGKGKVYHVGLYIGNGQMLHAPNSLKKVEIISLNTGVYKTNYAGARRYLQ
ncbi:NlpC/P60 family protein [Sporosarcina sp. HYO08]|uniref:NlpC/P60 family protein n=1 Tax=Sporosarcina sp. HYO08 TaxID=1759557 RepID=UPI00155ECE3D|nr:NlpC/P60 family protein [Sporosarcina sp. HYO08]